MVLDPIPQSLPVHFFGSRPQPPTSRSSRVLLLTVSPCLSSRISWCLMREQAESCSSSSRVSPVDSKEKRDKCWLDWEERVLTRSVETSVEEGLVLTRKTRETSVQHFSTLLSRWLERESQHLSLVQRETSVDFRETSVDSKDTCLSCLEHLSLLSKP